MDFLLTQAVGQSKLLMLVGISVAGHTLIPECMQVKFLNLQKIKYYNRVCESRTLLAEQHGHKVVKKRGINMSIRLEPIITPPLSLLPTPILLTVWV